MFVSAINESKTEWALPHNLFLHILSTNLMTGFLCMALCSCFSSFAAAHSPHSSHPQRTLLAWLVFVKRVSSSSLTRVNQEQTAWRQLSYDATASRLCPAKTRLNDLVFTAWATLRRRACPSLPPYPACSSLRCLRGRSCSKTRSVLWTLFVCEAELNVWDGWNNKVVTYGFNIRNFVCMLYHFVALATCA